jgi:hypothetical protein
VFERFTDRARRVVVLAQEEARLLNHNYIGTEHLLLGLIHEGEGVAAQVLTGMDVSLDTVRRKVEEIIGFGSRAPSGHIPFTPRSKKVLEMSLREALQLGHNYIGTEHILLGLLREGEGVAAQVLTKLGCDLSGVRQTVVQLLSGHPEQAEAITRSVSGELPPEPDSSISAAPRSGIEPARCGFCGIPSPECGPLFTGVSAALICSACARVAAGPSVRFPAGRMTAPPVRESLDVKAARYHVMGPPPEDEDAARGEIADAFKHLMELSPDGSILVNVEDGRELKPYGDEILARVGWFIRERENVVERVKFLDASHAVVWWELQFASGQPVVPWAVYHEGRAVVDDGRWKVARETVCERWAQAGVRCPPRSDT